MKTITQKIANRIVNFNVYFNATNSQEIENVMLDLGFTKYNVTQLVKLEYDKAGQLIGVDFSLPNRNKIMHLTTNLFQVLMKKVPSTSAEREEFRLNGEKLEFVYVTDSRVCDDIATLKAYLRLIALTLTMNPKIKFSSAEIEQLTALPAKDGLAVLAGMANAVVKADVFDTASVRTPHPVIIQDGVRYTYTGTELLEQPVYTDGIANAIQCGLDGHFVNVGWYNPDIYVSSVLVAAGLAKDVGDMQTANRLFALLCARGVRTFLIETDYQNIERVECSLKDPAQQGYYDLLHVVQYPYTLCIPLPLLNPSFLQEVSNLLQQGRIGVVPRMTHNRELEATTASIYDCILASSFEYPVHELVVDDQAVEWMPLDEFVFHRAGDELARGRVGNFIVHALKNDVITTSLDDEEEEYK